METDNIYLSRNKEHELIMSSFYNCLIYINADEEFSLEEILENNFETSYEDISFYVKEVMIKSLSNLNEIMNLFQANMKNWKFSRLNNIIKAILITSYTKGCLASERLEKRINIDIAVRLAKKYGDEKDYKFVNGILDNLL